MISEEKMSFLFVFWMMPILPKKRKTFLSVFSNLNDFGSLK